MPSFYKWLHIRSGALATGLRHGYGKSGKCSFVCDSHIFGETSKN